MRIGTRLPASGTQSDHSLILPPAALTDASSSTVHRIPSTTASDVALCWASVRECPLELLVADQFPERWLVADQVQV